MTVQELIEELSYVNPDAEIRFASQPSWPFEYSFSGPVEVVDEDGFPTVYLVEGSQLGYLPGEAKDEIGW
jgi:hypothetical protein